MKNTIKSMYFMLFILALAASRVEASIPALSGLQQDTLPRTYSGRVLDADTKKPVVFVNVYLAGSSLGTVTNAEGEFVLKIPYSELNNKVGFSYLGYQNYEIPVSELSEENNVIRLTPSVVDIQATTIRSTDPMQLITMAMNNVRFNYAAQPERFVGFYRETVKENRNYVMVAEAVLDVYKASYRNDFDFDRVAIFKGRKSGEVTKMDTINFKLQGGPKTSFILDLVKNPGGILSDDYIEFYDFKFAGIASIDDRNNYVIEFDQKDGVDLSLYKGKIYIDAGNMAFSRFEFALSDKKIETANNELVRKKPMDMRVNVISAIYMVNYRITNQKWYLNHVRSELIFETIWKKKRFNATYVTALEMAVTDRDSLDVTRSRYRRVQTTTGDILADKVSYFRDDNFWGDYNYIKPEEPIESVIKRLNRRLMWETLDEEEE